MRRSVRRPRCLSTEAAAHPRMNFFAHQDQARRKSLQLVGLFALAVLGIVVGINLVLLLLLGVQQDIADRPLTAVLSEHAGLFLFSSLLVLAVIAVASATRIARLRQGGSKVAEMLGGTLVAPDTRDPLERRLLNVVEELALASGTPVPSVYILREEAGINAFAAGYSAGDAAVAITRGALETLKRSELQGVMAHEFSHVVNGDMRLNTRLIGVLFGILVLTVIGRMLLHGTRFRATGRGRQGAAAVMAIAVALLVLGYIGVFFGRLIKAGVSRQRELLADASAVQFTREPEGLAGALKKIAAAQGGSLIDSPEAEEVSHMLFGPGFRRMSGLLATHPPILTRIQALEPHFDAQALARFSAQWQRQQASAEQQEAARAEPAGSPLPGFGQLPGGGAINPALITGVLLAELSAAGRAGSAPAMARLIASLPAPIYEAAHQRESAACAVIYLLLDSEVSVREQQLRAVAASLGAAAVSRLQDWAAAGLQLAAAQRLPVLELAMPALRQHTADELQQLEALIEILVKADGRISIFEYALATLFRSHLRDVLDPAGNGPGGRQRLQDCGPAAATLLAVLARAGGKDEAAAAAAYAAGINCLQLAEPPGYAWPADWTTALDTALVALDELRLPDLEALVGALGVVATHDQQVTLEQFELLRALCGALHCPLPPLLPTEAAG